MRMTVDIPDALYRELKGEAAREGSSVKELILRAIKQQLERPRPRTRVKLPIIRSKHPGTLDIDNVKIYEIVPFP